MFKFVEIHWFFLIFRSPPSADYRVTSVSPSVKKITCFTLFLLLYTTSQIH